jgi:protein-S-isoprenylcysteine O-methyltransferase Ste14
MTTFKRITRVEPANQAASRQRQSEEWQRAEIIGAYLSLMVGLFVVCATKVSLKVALWGFGFLYVGSALILLLWWWHESHRGAKAKSKPSRVLQQEPEAEGALLIERTVSVRR